MVPAVCDISSEDLPSVLHERRHTSQELKELRAPQLPSNARFQYEGNIYCSRSEAACGALMERFIPGFKIKEGQTFQIALGVSLRGNIFSADFCVDGVLIEYHPPRFYREGHRFGDFNSAREYFEYHKKIHALTTSEQKARFKEHVREKLSEHYFWRRRVIIDRNPELRGTELIVASTPEEFYKKVIMRFGEGDLPTQEEFADMFRQIQEDVIELRGGNIRFDMKRFSRRQAREQKRSERQRSAQRVA